ncbi:DsbA family protein [Candidatus Parvarchaeota archaeon]|nr:DsbA family protein [Candidatus Parvarchaeota archaeon]
MEKQNDQSHATLIGVSVILAALLISASLFMTMGQVNDSLKKIGTLGAANPGTGANNGGGSNNPVVNPPTNPPTQGGSNGNVAPTAIPIKISFEGKPVKGVQNAKIKIVEYSDFECTFCSRALPAVSQVLDQYKGKIGLYYKQFPLTQIHPNAQKAAEASECASDQGKFWEYHDKLFENQNALGIASLKQYAKDLKLDEAKFAACLDGGSKATAVSTEQSEGVAFGVGGTPSFVIFSDNKSPAMLSALGAVVSKYKQQYGPNFSIDVVQVNGGGYGISFSGALPLETFKGIIEPMAA